MPCECCTNARIGPAYALFDPACRWCGARLIQRIQRKPILREDKIRRCKTVLADWLKYGHDEQEIRRLAKLEALPLEPDLSTTLSTGRGKRGA